MMISLENLAQAALDGAKKAGAEYALASASQGESTGVEIRKNSIYTSDYSLDSGLRLRAIYRGGTGYVSGNPRSASEAMELGRRGAALARQSQRDRDFHSLPRPGAKRRQPRGMYDPSLLKMGAADFVRVAQRVIEEARQVDAKMVISSGGVGRYYSEGVLITSTGVCVAEKWTSAGMGLMAVLRRGGDTGYFWEGSSGRRRRDLRWRGLGRRAARKACSYIGAKQVKTGKVDLVLAPHAAQEMASSLCYAANAEDIQRNRNYLVGRLGKRVASRAITIIDDPFLPGAYGSGTYDGEGTAHRRIVVVKNGVLKSFLHNSYTAGKAGCRSTGHASALGMGIGPTNIVLSRGKVSQRQMIESVQEGIYIEMGGVDPNPASGDISATIDFGFRIEKGKLTHPIKNAVVGTTVFEFLEGIDAVSSDVKVEAGLPMPGLCCRNVLVAGGE